MKKKIIGVSPRVCTEDGSTRHNVQDTYIAAIHKEKADSDLDWCMLLVTDVINDTSVLITTGHAKESKFYWEKISESYYSLPGILSRKKQLLPEILRILED